MIKKEAILLKISEQVFNLVIYILHKRLSILSLLMCKYVESVVKSYCKNSVLVLE